jgi:hypothetical protein
MRVQEKIHLLGWLVDSDFEHDWEENDWRRVMRRYAEVIRHFKEERETT